MDPLSATSALPGSHIISGKLLNFKFSKLLFNKALDHTFIIGGPDGLPRYIKEKANQIFSLSELTFPHEMALLILAEQLYRAVSIEKGRNYHR